MTIRQSFSREFKLEAVRLLNQGEKSGADLALELGVRRNQLYKWRDQLSDKGDAAFQGSGRKPKDQESEIARLKRELAETQEERDILKKAAQYFARESK